MPDVITIQECQWKNFGDQIRLVVPDRSYNYVGTSKEAGIVYDAKRFTCYGLQLDDYNIIPEPQDRQKNGWRNAFLRRSHFVIFRLKEHGQESDFIVGSFHGLFNKERDPQKRLDSCLYFLEEFVVSIHAYFRVSAYTSRSIGD
jgi:hypothetical protein